MLNRFMGSSFVFYICVLLCVASSFRSLVMKLFSLSPLYRMLGLSSFTDYLSISSFFLGYLL